GALCGGGNGHYGDREFDFADLVLSFLGCSQIAQDKKRLARGSRTLAAHNKAASHRRHENAV
ncbi:MAG: hypothetical protein WAR76_04380, partial [Xanthobacteraceae bacterium]